MTRPILIAAAVLLSFLVAAPPGHAAWTWPLRGEVITPYRNGDDPYAGGQHRGIDIGGAVGSPVVAATPGEVRFAGTAGVSGLTVSLRTADGRYDTSYLHLSAVSVKKGDTVAAGDRVGAVGTTGTRSAVAPHLHFGVREAGSSQAYHDPLGFLPPLATAGQPQPAMPTPAPEAVPSAPVPRPAPQPVAGERRVPGGAPRTAPGRARVGATAPRRVPSGSAAPGRVRGGAMAPGRARGGVTARGGAHAPGRVRGGATAPGRVRDHAHGRTGAHGGARAPVGARVGVGEPAHMRASGGAPGGARAGLGAHTARPATIPTRSARRAAAHGAGLHGSADARGQAPASQPAGPRSRSATHASRDGAAHGRSPGAKTMPSHPAGGPDASWALACLGLLLAAGLVGTSGGGRDFVKRRGAAAGRALRPLLGLG